MSTSLLFGHIGRLASGTGLHVLSGSAEDVIVSHETVQKVAKSRAGYETNSSLAFVAPKQSVKDAFKFLNEAEYSSTNAGDFELDVQMITERESGNSICERMSNALDGAYRLLDTEQWGHKIFSNRYIGLVPPAEFLKVILKRQGSKSKRVILFACGIAPGKGGRTWFVSPQGFTWRQDRHIVVKGKPMDISNIMDRGHPGSPAAWLFAGITNAVPFITGNLYRKPEEDCPQIMSFTPEFEDYDALFAHVLDGVANMHDKHALRVPMDMIKNAVTLATKTGKMETVIRDLVNDGMITLDDDEGMW